MTEEEKRDIEQYIADTVTERPYTFTVGKTRLFLYPVTLGKMYRLRPLMESLGINLQSFQQNVSLEALRLAKEKQDVCLTIISYHTYKEKEKIDNPRSIAARKGFLKKNISDEDIASLLIMLLTADKTAIIMHHLGIDKEQDRLASVMRIKSKDDKNNLTFGGQSVFGSLIDAACERYGWTKEYVVWGIDYTSLRLMLADKINSVYCTDDEMKKIPAKLRSQSGAVLNADDKKTMEQIKNMNWR